MIYGLARDRGRRFRLTQDDKCLKNSSSTKKLAPLTSNSPPPLPQLHMKKQQKNSARAFALRIALALTLTSISAILLASTLRSPAAGPQPDRPAPDVVALVGPVSQDLDLRALRYPLPSSEADQIARSRHPFPFAGRQIQQSQFTQQLKPRVLAPIPNMPSAILTFPGITSPQSGCLCHPPDTD